MSNKRLFINLKKLDECKEFSAECSYFYHPLNEGLKALREYATYAVICRRCENGSCMLACPVEALEREENGMLKRWGMRCVSCKSCSLACPFGTILPELLPYKISVCDYCLEREPKEEPLCVKTASVAGVLEYKEVEEDLEKDIYFVGDNLAVQAIHWQREPVKTVAK